MLKLRHFASCACVGALLVSPISALADDYRVELDLSFDQTEFDFDGVPDARQFGIAGRYYLKPVVTDGLPLAEAAFLNRSSHLAAGTTRAELGDEKIDIFSAAFAYYVPNTIFYGRVGFTYLDDFSPGDRSIFDASVGIAPIDGLLLTTRFDEDGWDPNAAAKYVGKLPNSHFYALGVSVVEPDDGDTTVALDFDYYIDRTFSVGAGFASGADRWRLRAEKFFTPGFAVGGRISSGDNGDSIGATVAWRF